VRSVTDPRHALTIEVATRRLLRVATLFGVTASLVALLVTLQRGSELALVGLAVAWSAAWAGASAWPKVMISVLRHWRWTTALVAGASTTTILASGGFNSLLKTEADWLAWAAPVLLDTVASLAVAAILSTGLLASFLLAGQSLGSIITGPDRYIAVTDILNPFVVVLLALVVTAVFRRVLGGAGHTLWCARQGEAGSSPAMRALLGGEPDAILALPRGDSGHGHEPAKPLSPAERDIVDRLARGQTPQQIALARNVRDDTIYEQIGSAKHKTGAATIEHLIARAWRPPT
jgi:DNA-binding CsgD family transcriptional regulator